MGRKLLHLLNGLITCAVVVVLVIAGAYAGYALWDNQQIYDAAESSLSEMKEIRASLGMPSSVSALTELLEENRLARAMRAQEAREAAEKAQNAVPIETVAPAAPVETLVPDEVIASSEVMIAAALTPVAETTPESDEKTVSAATEKPVPAETTAPIPAEITAPVQVTAVPVTPVPVTPVPATPVPTEEPMDDSLFGQLKAINKDITAWITMPGTAIDYPVMQGSNNYSYINKDVYGSFALAGSIFLDYRNSSDYTDPYSLLYGHNMSKHRMFSDINLYKEEEFFNENTLGILLMPDGNHILETLSVIVTPASDSGVLNPQNWNILDGEGIFLKAQENAMFTYEKGLEDLREKIDAGETPKLIALSTCSDEFTEARTILLTLMDP